MKMKIFISVLYAVFVFQFNGLAHEEPAKSLYEKQKKEEAKQKILKSGIKSITVFKSAEKEAGMMKLMTMNYDSDGTYLSVEAFENDLLKLIVKYGYSKNDDMISDTDYNSEGVVLEKNIFRYDKQGRVVSGKSYEKNKISATFRFEHSTDKKQIVFQKYSTDKKPEYKLVYSYPDNYDLQDFSEVKKIMPDGTTEMTVTKEFNKLNQVVRKSVIGSDGKPDYYFEYFYDDMGNNIKITRNDPEGKMQKYDIVFFDPNGNITQKETYNAENVLVLVIIYEFQFFD